MTRGVKSMPYTAYSSILQHIAAALTLVCCGASAADALPNCYEQLAVDPPEAVKTRNYYLFVDQTMPLTDAMKNKISELVADWGQAGERLRVVRFSANTRGQYMEMLFDEVADGKPTPEYLFNIHPDNRPKLVQCLSDRDERFRKKFKGAVARVVNLTDKSLPRSELLSSLKELATKVIAPDAGTEQTVLLVTDGMENSSFASFYQRRTVIRSVDTHKTLTDASKSNLIPVWHGAKIYMYGLGYVPDEKFYVNAKLLQPLKEFWQSYFSLGKAQLMELGTPELMLTSLK